MRIVIDLQGAQTENSPFEISCYIKSLAKALIRNRGDNEIIIALSDHFPDSVELIRAEFDGLLSQNNIRVWCAPSYVKLCEPSNNWLRESAELIREAFIASLQPDIVYISHLMCDGSVVTSINKFAKNICTIAAIFNSIEKGGTQQDDFLKFYKHKMNGAIKRACLCHIILPSNVKPVSVDSGFSAKQIYQGQVAFDVAVNDESFDDEALRLIDKFKDVLGENLIPEVIQKKILQADQKKLAFVSPLPPERSGISDYSSELLPELSRYYNIDVVVDQEIVNDPWVTANCRIRSVDWFVKHANCFDRVLYHFGNSPLHKHMFDLLNNVKGVVVLHDYFLNNVLELKDAIEFSIHSGIRHDIGVVKEIYHSHGYKAVQAYFDAENKQTYPCNLSVQEMANGIIFHSDATLKLVDQWNGRKGADNFSVIPLLRSPAVKINKSEARKKLGFSDDHFIVCSFGMLGPGKLNHRLLSAWLNSLLASKTESVLVFVGENDGHVYGQQILNSIKESGLSDRVLITGWIDANTYREYLSAADIGVQLRCESRGEVSAAVLDCMNYGLSVIVNAIGSMADIPDNAVFKLANAFKDVELTRKLEKLWKDSASRYLAADKAKALIESSHEPRHCAFKYAKAIEGFYAKEQYNKKALVAAIAELDYYSPSNYECLAVAKSIAQSIYDTQRGRRIFIDISAVRRSDLRTGIQRVVRALLLEFIKSPPDGYRVEPVYLSDENNRWHLNYARLKTLELLECPAEWANDEEVEVQAGDLYLGLDFSAGHVIESAGLLSDLHRIGVEIRFVVYDILPVVMPTKFPAGSAEAHEQWLKVISKYDGVLCISRSVSDDFSQWQKNNDVKCGRCFQNDWFHLGADVDASAPTTGYPADAEKILGLLSSRPTFLMVGTIEPRKGHSQVLTAFERLWDQELDINLVIVGKKGWMVDLFMEKLAQHHYLNRKVFFLDGISDEFLEKVYAASICLIAASEGEGFGLPLIEAAQHKLPIIARDIPVFREVAGEHAFYFSGDDPAVLAATVQSWITLYESGQHPNSDSLPWLTWSQSASQLLEAIGINILDTKRQLASQ